MNPHRCAPLLAIVTLVGCSAGSTWPTKGPVAPKRAGIDRKVVDEKELAALLNDNPASLARRAKDGAGSGEAVAGGAKGGKDGNGDDAPAPDAEPIMKKAVAALEAGDYETAGRLAAEVIAIDPTGYAYAYVILGDVALNAKAYEKALDYYKRALELDPKDGWAAQRMAQAYRKLGKMLEARATLRKFTEQNPGADADTWDALAWIELEMGDSKRAEAAFRKALEASDGQDAEAWYGLALIHARRGDALAVERDLTALFALQPERRLVIERDPTFFRMRIHANVAKLFSPKLMAEAKLAAENKKKGEPVAAQQVKLAVPGGPEKVLADHVRFDFDSAAIRPESKALLDEIAGFLKSQKGLEFVEITGHADRRGDEAYNVKLSEQRARAVAAALVARGVPSTTLKARGYGVYCPLDDGDDESAYAKNRRVQFAIAAGGKVLGDELTCVERMKSWLKPTASAVRWIPGKK
ncbi:MAG: OmpA family protein [Deltaproteobacteria bacterium]|nr:OmpA family protein [Deltaproteobacteria bacterium]